MWFQWQDMYWFSADFSPLEFSTFHSGHPDKSIQLLSNANTTNKETKRKNTIHFQGMRIQNAVVVFFYINFNFRTRIFRFSVFQLFFPAVLFQPFSIFSARSPPIEHWILTKKLTKIKQIKNCIFMLSFF